ncbi:MAG: ComEC/Rec2 family competence protein [Clostridia bacterium]|nr:ComEC/Rec2 family competence protein [Clostridia bacterium]
MKRVMLLIAALFVVTSTLFYLFSSVALLIFGAVLCIAAFGLAVFSRRFNLGYQATFILAVGAIYCVGLLLWFAPTVTRVQSLKGQERQVICRVEEEPVLRDDYVQVLVETFGVDRKLEGVGRAVRFYLNMDIEQNASSAVEGDILKVDVKFLELNEIGRKSRMAERVYISAACEDAEIIGHKANLYTKIVGLRRGIKRAVDSFAYGDDAALIKGLLLGDTSQMSDELYSQFKICGVSHVTAVSGMHVGVFSMMAMSVLSLFMSRRKASLWALVPLTVVCLLAGLTPSAVRAGIMCAVMLVANFLFRKSDGLNSLGLAVAVMLTFNPFYILSLSFQLSCCATAGVIIVMPYAMTVASRIPEMGGVWALKRVLESAVLNVIQSVGAVVCTLPIQIAEFGSVSLICPVAGVLISAAAVYVMCVATLGVAIAFIPFVDVAAEVPFFVARVLTKYIRVCVSLLSEVPFAVLPVSRNSAFIFLGVSMVIIGVWACFKLPYRRRAAVLLVAVLLCVSVGVDRIASKDTVQTAMLDVDRGFCTVVSTGTSCVIIGCGDDEYDRYTVESYLKTNGITDVEAVFLPSDEASVYGGFESLKSSRSFEKTVIGCDKGNWFELLDGGLSVRVLTNEGKIAYLLTTCGKTMLISHTDFKPSEGLGSVDTLIMGRKPIVGAKAETIVAPNGVNGKFLSRLTENDRVFVATEGTVVVKLKEGKGLAVYAG